MFFGDWLMLRFGLEFFELCRVRFIASTFLVIVPRDLHRCDFWAVQIVQSKGNHRSPQGKPVPSDDVRPRQVNGWGAAAESPSR